MTDKNGNVIIKIMQAKLWWVHRRRKYREIREKDLSEKWGRSIIGTEYLTKEKDYGKNVSKLREYFK